MNPFDLLRAALEQPLVKYWMFGVSAGIGTVLALLGLIRMLRARYRICLKDRPRAAAPRTDPQSAVGAGWSYAAALLVVLAVAFTVRAYGLEDRGITHVEVYIPGISLPEDISEPPPRHGLLQQLIWNFHHDPHPPAYWAFMSGWTRAFGVSLTSIRLPSVIAGSAAVLLLYVLASMLFGPKVGLLSAALLALNGPHIFWSQHARMYVPSCLIALLSTLLLVKLLRSSRPDVWQEAGYAIVTWAGVLTQLLFWPFLAAQMLSSAVFAEPDQNEVPRTFKLQSVVLMLGAPLWAHAAYRSRAAEYLDQPVWPFVQDYLVFGFLFEPDTWSIPMRNPDPAVEWLLLLLAFACLVSAVASRPGGPTLRASGSAGNVRRLLPVAIGCSLVTFSLALVASRARTLMALTALLPLVVLALLVLWPKVWPRLGRWLTYPRVHRWAPDNVLLLLILALVPVALLVALSSAKTVFTSRGLLVSTPFLIALLAAGAVYLAQRWRMGLLVVGLIIAVHVASANYYRGIPTPIDYRSLASGMKNRLEEQDLIFVRPRHWAITPVFYHLLDEKDRLVGRDYPAALKARPGARVWVPVHPELPPSEEISSALAGHRAADSIQARRAQALLYEPASPRE